MNYSEHWPRWIKASIAEHFKVLAGTTLFVEGFERATEDKPHWVELRIDGPYCKEQTKGSWKITVEVNTNISVTEGQQNAYTMEEIIGNVAKLFDCICVYKYGSGGSDDQSKLGCFRLKTQGREQILITNFGKVRPDTRVLQSSIEGHFEMFLS